LAKGSVDPLGLALVYSLEATSAITSMAMALATTLAVTLARLLAMESARLLGLTS